MKDKFFLFLLGLLSIVIISQTLFISIVNQPTPLYERVIERFAETHNYDKELYNCVNYSEDLAFVLENLGYETTQERYINTTDGYHRRLNLILEIEGQTGEIIVNRK